MKKSKTLLYLYFLVVFSVVYSYIIVKNPDYIYGNVPTSVKITFPKEISWNEVDVFVTNSDNEESQVLLMEIESLGEDMKPQLIPSPGGGFLKTNTFNGVPSHAFISFTYHSSDNDVHSKVFTHLTLRSKGENISHHLLPHPLTVHKAYAGININKNGNFATPNKNENYCIELPRSVMDNPDFLQHPVIKHELYEAFVITTGSDACTTGSRSRAGRVMFIDKEIVVKLSSYKNKKEGPIEYCFDMRIKENSINDFNIFVAIPHINFYAYTRMISERLSPITELYYNQDEKTNDDVMEDKSLEHNMLEEEHEESEKDETIEETYHYYHPDLTITNSYENQENQDKFENFEYFKDNQNSFEKRDKLQSNDGFSTYMFPGLPNHSLGRMVISFTYSNPIDDVSFQLESTYGYIGSLHSCFYIRPPSTVKNQENIKNSGFADNTLAINVDKEIGLVHGMSFREGTTDVACIFHTKTKAKTTSGYSKLTLIQNGQSQLYHIYSGGHVAGFVNGFTHSFQIQPEITNPENILKAYKTSSFFTFPAQIRVDSKNQFTIIVKHKESISSFLKSRGPEICKNLKNLGYSVDGMNIDQTLGDPRCIGVCGKGCEVDCGKNEQCKVDDDCGSGLYCSVDYYDSDHKFVPGTYQCTAKLSTHWVIIIAAGVPLVIIISIIAFICWRLKRVEKYVAETEGILSEQEKAFNEEWDRGMRDYRREHNLPEEPLSDREDEDEDYHTNTTGNTDFNTKTYNPPPYHSNYLDNSNTGISNPPSGLHPYHDNFVRSDNSNQHMNQQLHSNHSTSTSTSTSTLEQHTVWADSNLGKSRNTRSSSMDSTSSFEFGTNTGYIKLDNYHQPNYRNDTVFSNKNPRKYQPFKN